MTDLLVQPIIIKKVKKGGHAHHGGAWKVAYADFVTAMMAFFLLLWLLNATTEEQKSGIADYFSPASVSSTGSGSGGVLGGQSISVDGNQVSSGGPTEGGATLPIPPAVTSPAEVEDDAPEAEPTESDSAKEVVTENVDELLARREQEQFDAAESALRDAIESIPELEALQASLVIEQTPEGLRIQLIDREGFSMFASGSATPNKQLVQLIGLVAKVVTQMPNKLAISGHTDSVPFHTDKGYSNWELSADRANAARRLLVTAGLDQERIANVQGRSATEPYLPKDTTNPSNRRISIVLLRENTNTAPLLEEGKGAKIFKAEQDKKTAPAPRRNDPARDARTQNVAPRS